MNEALYNKAGFEIEPCSRCGGSGSYSYNPMDGTRCFKCGGAKFVLTKRGAAARAKYLKSLERPAGELKTDDYIFDYIGLGSKRVWGRVGEITKREMLCDGKPSIMVEMKRGGKVVQCRICTLDEPVMSVALPEDQQEYLAKAVAYQSSLTKAGKPRAKGA